MLQFIVTLLVFCSPPLYCMMKYPLIMDVPLTHLPGAIGMVLAIMALLALFKDKKYKLWIILPLTILFFLSELILLFFVRVAGINIWRCFIILIWKIFGPGLSSTAGRS